MIVVIVFILQWFLSVRFSVCTDLFPELLIISSGIFLSNKYLLGFLSVGRRLHMSRINEDRIRIYETFLHALVQDLLEDLLEQVCSFEASLVILTKCAEVRDGIMETKSKEPAVCHIDLDLLDRLPHALDAEHVLDDRYLDQSYRIDARASVVP